jgi:hypothetical protein
MPSAPPAARGVAEPETPDHAARAAHLGSAAHLARRLGRRARAGGLLLARGRLGEAARSFAQAGGVARALEALGDGPNRRSGVVAEPATAEAPGEAPPESPYAPAPLRRPPHAPPSDPPPAWPTTPEAWERANVTTERVPRVSGPPPVRVDLPPESAALSEGFAPGAVVAERYRIEARIGAGGMSAVYRARDLELGEDVALKVFSVRPHDESLLERFKRELCVSRQLAHPNVVHLYDIGTFRGRKFISMELLRGCSLRDELARGPLAPRRAIHVLVQACAGLDTAHRAGVVHRDVKPENLFVTDEGLVKVMDFGIAKRRAASTSVAVAGWVAGTPTYMAPEQITSFDAVTPLADVYALGVCAFEMLTGAPPFVADSSFELLVMQLSDPPPSPRARSAAVSPALDELVLRLLDKDPARRVQSCAEVAARLLGVLAESG